MRALDANDIKRKKIVRCKLVFMLHWAENAVKLFGSVFVAHVADIYQTP